MTSHAHVTALVQQLPAASLLQFPQYESQSHQSKV